MISGICTFSELDTVSTSAEEVLSLTFFIVQSRAYLIDPARRPCAEMFTQVTSAIGFSRSPSAEKIRRAPVIWTSLNVMLCSSQRPRSGGVTGVASTVHEAGMFLESFGIVA